MTGMTQKAFAELYGIPLSTLRKWEQGEANPPDYVVRLLARTLPGTDPSLRKLVGKQGQTYYYSPVRSCVMDGRGNEIQIYLEDLFEDFYVLQKKFNQDCYYDKQEDILWSR